MNLCSHGHEEICFESRKCPMCELEMEKERLQERIDELKSEIEALQEERANMEESK